MAENRVEIDITVEERDALRALTALTKKTKDYEDQAKKTSKTVDRSFKDIAKGVLAANAVQGAFNRAAAKISDAVDQYREFQKSVAEVNTLLPENAKLTDDITDSLIELSTQFGTRPQAQAQALYQVISSGAATGADAVELLASANELALGGLAELGDVVNVLTDVINVYGAENINAQEASDALFTTVRLGKTNISELSASIGQVIPLSERLNVSFDEIGAALATLTTQGLTTNQRVTQLNALFTAILKKGGDVEKTFGKDVAEAFNITALRTKGLNQFLQDLITATGGSEEVLVKLLGRAEAAQAVFGLTGNATATFTNNIAQFSDKAGAASDAAQELQGSLDFQLQAADQSVTNLINKITSELEPATTRILAAFNAFSKRFVQDSEGFVGTTEDIVQAFEDAAKTANNIDLKRTTADADDLAKQIQFVRKQIADAATREDSIFLNDKDDLELLNQRLDILVGKLNEQRGEPFFQIAPEEGTESVFNILANPEDQKQAQAGVRQFFDIVTEGQNRVKQNQEGGLLLVGPGGDPAENAKAETEAIVSELERRQEILEAIRADAALQEEERRLEALVQRDEATEEDLQNLQDVQAARKTVLEDFQKQEQALIQKNAKAKNAAEKKAADERLKIERDTFFKVQEFEKLSGRQRVANLKSTLGAISTLTSSSNKTLFTIGKAAAIGTATIDGISAVQKALASAPPPFNFALAALVGTATAANIAKIASQKPPAFQQGGFVPGNSFNGDNVLIRANSDEFVANRQQQRNIISNLANNPVTGSSDEVVREISGLKESILSQPIILTVDNKEIARAVRTSSREGLAV